MPFLFVTAMAGSFGYELDLNFLSNEEKEAVYRTEDGAAYTGDTLMHAGVLLPKSWGDYDPVSMYFISE